MATPQPALQNPTNLRPVELLTPDEIGALIRAASGRAPTGIRNRGIIVVAWRGGLRVQEFLGLFPRDLDPENGTVNIVHGRRWALGVLPPALTALIPAPDTGPHR